MRIRITLLLLCCLVFPKIGSCQKPPGYLGKLHSIEIQPGIVLLYLGDKPLKPSIPLQLNVNIKRVLFKKISVGLKTQYFTGSYKLRQESSFTYYSHSPNEETYTTHSADNLTQLNYGIGVYFTTHRFIAPVGPQFGVFIMKSKTTHTLKKNEYTYNSENNTLIEQEYIGIQDYRINGYIFGLSYHDQKYIHAVQPIYLIYGIQYQEMFNIASPQYELGSEEIDDLIHEFNSMNRFTLSFGIGYTF